MLVLLLVSLFFILSSCADKEKQEMQNLTKQPLQQPTQGQMNQKKLCGDGICDAAEEKDLSMCPVDCAEKIADEESTE